MDVYAIDITAEQRKTVLALLARHLPNTTAWAYGSRVKWTSRPESDLDLVVFAKPEQERRVSDLREAFEESNLPFRVDLFVWDTVPEQFRKTIEAEHVVLVERRELPVGREWPIMSLREAGVSLIDCEHRTPPAAERGYPYVAIPQVKDGRINLNGVRRITRERFDEWTRKADPKSFDIVLSRRCNPGETGFVSEGLKFALGQNLVLLRSDETKVFKPFLRWLVRGSQWWGQVGMHINVGAVFDSLKCADIPGFCLPVPPLPEQRAIAHILGTLDDKIELNRRMNQTLEAMARAVFKSWFVDFDPVRAKATLKHHDTTPPQGGSDWSVERARAYLDRMDPNITALFPDRFVDSELGPIPAGWQVKALGKLIKLAYGKALKSEDRKNGKIPVYGSNGQVGWHTKELVAGPGIVVGRKGNPGVVTWAHSDFFPIDTTFYVLPGDAIYKLTFLFFALSDQDLPSVSADSAVPGLNRNLAYMNRQVAPPKPVAEEFDACATEIFTRRHHLELESRTLANLRDTLLSKLISGKLRVKDVESFVAKVASP